MTTDPLEIIPKPLLEAFKKRDFSELTPIQRAVLEWVRSDSSAPRAQDLRIASQTGSGKTVAFGFALAPLLLEASDQRTGQKATQALVIVPTRELVTQVCQELGWLYAGVPGVGITGLMGGAPMLRERGALSRKPILVVATPGRLLDHIRNGALSCDAINHVVLDEADRLLDMGFREELDEILNALPKDRRSHMASATFPDSVRKLANRFQRDALEIQGPGAKEAHPDITHVAHVIRPRDTYSALLNILLLARGSRSLIFVKRRIDAAEIAEKLASDGFGAMPLSGDLPQAQRNRTLNAFRNGSLDTLVATDVAARGIDVPDIANVIHLDTPYDAETYVHRSGRTGRAGSEGRSVMLIPGSQERRMRTVLSKLGITAAWVPTPGPKQVRKGARKDQRRALWQKLEETEAFPETQVQYAESLLGSHEPKVVIAALLEMAMPPLPCEPREIGQPAADQKSRARPRGKDYVTFSISCGKRSGATKSRILSQICRRGDVSGEVIGSIRIEASRSLFQIVREAAKNFEKKASRPDRRDPGVHIERIREDTPSRASRPPRKRSTTEAQKKAPSTRTASRKKKKSARSH